MGDLDPPGLIPARPPGPFPTVVLPTIPRGKLAGTFNIFLKADPNKITFELAGEFDFWMVGEAYFLWRTKKFKLPVPPSAGINAPAKIYQHSWPNPV